MMGPTHMDRFMDVLEDHKSSADKPDVYVSTIKRKLKTSTKLRFLIKS